MKPGPIGTPAEILVDLAKEGRVTLAALTRMIGRPRGYLATFVRGGYPAVLAEADRKLLGSFFRVPDWWFESGVVRSP